jgi:hypothetical protein
MMQQQQLSNHTGYSNVYRYSIDVVEVSKTRLTDTYARLKSGVYGMHYEKPKQASSADCKRRCGDQGGGVMRSYLCIGSGDMD